MMFDPAKLTPSKRALGTFCAIAAGTAAAVTAAPAVAAGIVGVAGLFTNFLADDIGKIWDERNTDPKYSHPNHDLERLVGDAIASVLYGKSREACEKDDLKKFDKLAKNAAETYLKLAGQQYFAELASQNLPELFRQAAEKPDEEMKLLTPEIWSEFVAIIDAKLQLKTDKQKIQQLSMRLHRRLMPAIREMVKRNFGGDGRAYAALSLDMSATLMKYAAKNQAADQDIQQQLQVVLEQLETIQTDQRAALTPDQARALRWLVDEFSKYRQVWLETHRIAQDSLTGIVKLNEQQQLDSERLANIEALLKAQFANKTAGEDPTQKQLPPELIEQVKLLLERGNQEQQALAEIALKNHAAADTLIQELKRNPLAEAFRLLTLEGDNWYEAGEFDRAIEPYEQALALQPCNITVRNNAAVAHQKARHGEKTAHLQRCLAIYEKTLEILGNRRDPEWAMTQGNLGNALRGMPIENQAEDLRRALLAYESALEVFTRAKYPAHWAKTKNNLGIVWCNMPTGIKAENLFRAIASHEAALEIFTREEYPIDWARTQNNLGVAWYELGSGDQGNNLRRAISAYESSLEIFTRESDPVAWANLQHNLGLAWQKLRNGDRESNLLHVIAAYEAALEIRTRETNPLDWAKTLLNLGVAWRELTRENREENLRRSIVIYNLVLEVYSLEDHPLEWAATQHNLGISWLELRTCDKESNVRRAIDAFEAALKVKTRETHPLNWANTQNSIGNAWAELQTDDQIESLRSAIVAYQAALSIYTCEANPENWAMTRYNLSSALASMAKTDSNQSCYWLRRAISSSKSAALVYTLEQFPSEHEKVIHNLAIDRAAYEAAGCSAEIPFDDIPPAE